MPTPSLYETSGTTIDVAAVYGVSANGTTDNSVCLMRMNADLAGPNKPFYTIIFPEAGEVRYSDNRWLMGILRFKIIAEGVTFRCTSSSPWDFLRQPFSSGDMFYNYPASNNPGTTDVGSLFNSAAIGALTITLTTAGQAAGFAAGNRIFLYGRDQQHLGYPPNARYFQWNEVISADAGTGIITLKYPLRDNFNASWQDLPNYLNSQGFGKPRVINLDRGINNYILPYHVEFVGCKFGIGTVGPQAGAFGFTADTIILRRVTTEDEIWPSQNRIAKYFECTFASSDLDKMCDDVYFEDCRFMGAVFAGTGFRKAKYYKCKIDAEAALLSREVVVEGCTIRGNTGNIPFRLHPQAIPCDHMTIKDLNFIVGPSASYDACIDLGGWNTFTVGSVSGTNIILNDNTGDPQDASDNVANAIGAGTWMMKSDGSKGGYVKDVTYNGSNQYVILGTWVAPVAGEVWSYRVVKNIIDLGGHTVSDPLTPLYAPNSMLYAGNTNYGSGIRTTRWKGNTLRWFEGSGDCIMDMYGYIVDIHVIVSKPYTGGVSNPKMYLFKYNSFDPIMEINLSALGTRIITPYEVWGAKTLDNIGTATTHMPGYQRQLDLVLGGGGSTILGLTPEQLPEVEVIMRWVPGSTG